MNLTEKDLEVINFLSKYGATETMLLANKFYPNLQSAQKRLMQLSDANRIQRDTQTHTTYKNIGRGYVYTVETKRKSQQNPNDFIYTYLIPYFESQHLNLLDWKRNYKTKTAPYIQFDLIIHYSDQLTEKHFVTFVQVVTTLEDVDKLLKSHLFYTDKSYYEELGLTKTVPIILLTFNKGLINELSRKPLYNAIILDLEKII